MKFRGGGIEPAEETDSDNQKEPEEAEGTEKTDSEEQEPTEEETEQETDSEDTVVDEENEILQALLERIDALPDAEEYLATEPDADGGEADAAAYEEWLAKLYAYVEEAVAIQEAVEELTEEERAAIPEEALAKLAAWVEIAQTVGESAQVMTAENSAMMAVEPAAQSDNIASGDDWVLDKDGKLTISSDAGWDGWIDKKAEWIDNHTYAWNVKSVEIQNTVTVIPEKAFMRCLNVDEITIPVSVKSIGNEAFKKLNLYSVTMQGTEPPALGTAVFTGCLFVNSGLQGIHIPSCQYLNAYLAAEGWSAYQNNIDASHTGGISYSAGYRAITQKCGGCGTTYGTATMFSGGPFFTYTGTAITPVTVSYTDSNSNTWQGEKPTDITYENNINAGEATASLTLGTGENAATATLSFTIDPKTLTDDMVALSDASFPHTGNAVAPTVTVQDGSTTLTEGTDYILSYTDNIDVGRAAVTVTGMGNYKGTVAKNFEIVESGADKVAAAVPIVETALAGITATNATTKEEILGVINTALSNANITGVSVAIDKFVKYEASTSAAGSVTGVVFITCGQESENVHMEKTIAQLTAGKYTVTVNNGTGSGEYAEGDTVTITANAAPSGKQFDKWEINSGSVTLADATSSATTFTMPAEAVSVTAAYKDIEGGGDNQGGGNQDGGDNSGGEDSGNTGSGGNQGGSNQGSGGSGGGNSGGNQGDNGGSSGGAGDDSGSGDDSNNSAAVTMTPKPAATGSSGTGQPRVKQEKEGNIRKEVSVTGESTLDAAVETPLSKLADIVLTETEKQQAAAGTDIRLVLDVKDAAAVVSAADKAVVEAALNGSLAQGYTLGQYLDISLYKVIGESRNAIKETDGKITVTIIVPDSLKNTDGSRTRTFAVIRVHDGRAELLADLDSSADTITIETDRFSTYAIVYQDSPNGGKAGNANDGGGNNGTKAGSGKDNEPKTGDAAPIELCATLGMIVGFAYLLLYFSDRKRGMSEETKKELVSHLIRWAKQGGRIRKYLALAAIFALLVYYHSIGKKTCVEWKEIYGE